ncbi:MAG: hypothetical protein DLM69_01745 [Candidatus Chloroheliales bacterium]|nr:MAG: hypothetical protein DLM69_01745 [Chloroflexota bacterium]
MARIQHLFIVRVWQEPGSTEAAAQWRGSVEHTPTTDRFYFASFTDLLDFITLRLNHAAEPHQSNQPDQKVSNL